MAKKTACEFGEETRVVSRGKTTQLVSADGFELYRHKSPVKVTIVRQALCEGHNLDTAIRTAAQYSRRRGRQ